MNYLQKILVLLEQESYQEELLHLKGQLMPKGISLDMIWLREELYHHGGLQDAYFPNGAFQDAGCAIPDEAQPGQLLITDNAAAAGVFAGKGYPVLAFLHEKNRDQAFPGIRYAMEQPGELEEEYLERVYRRLTGQPWEILNTVRCILRETIQEDVEAFYRIYSNPQITKYTENLYPEIEEEKEYVKQYIEKIYGFYGFGVWTVVEKETEAVIGRAGFSYREGYESPELGFIIGAPWQRRGIAFEICEAILSYGDTQLGFERVNALVQPDNLASLRLCEKLGFKKQELLVMEGQNYLRLEKNFKDLKTGITQ